MYKKQNLSLTDVFAEVRNKLQSALTVLEGLKKGKKIPDKLIKGALKDLDKAVKVIS